MPKRDKIFKKADALLQASDQKPDLLEAAQNVLLSNLLTYAAASKKLHPGGFQNVLLVEDKDPSLTISKIYSKGLQAKDFVDFAGVPLLETELTPYFNLYKINRDPNGEILSVLKIPLFGEATKDAILTPGAEATTAVGLQNLQWQFKDQTAFGAERLVEVQMKLIFSEPSIMGLTYETENVLNPDSTSESPFQTFQYIDLIRRSNGRRPLSDVVSGDKYETYSLRLDIGYSPKPEHIIKSLSGGQLTEDFVRNVMSSATEVNNISLLLELQDYDLNIMEDGRVELSLSYFSFLERQSETLDYDIFADFDIISPEEIDRRVKSSPISEQRAEKIKRKASLKKQIEDAERAVQKLAGFKTETVSVGINQFQEKGVTPDDEQRRIETGFKKAQIAQVQEILEEVNEDLEKLEEDLLSVRARIVTSNKIKRYGKIMEEIHKRGKIFHIEINKDKRLMYSKHYLKFLKQALEDSNRKDDVKNAALMLANERSLKASQKMNKSNFDKSFNPTGKIEAAAKALKQSREDLSDEEIQKVAIAQGYDTALGKAMTAENTNDKIMIHFIYLGDLIDAILNLGNLKRKMRDDKFGLMLGSFSFMDANDLLTNMPILGASDFRFPESINFADIPISLELFSRFFAATIIDKGITKLQMLDFVNALVNQLAVPSLNMAIGGVPNQHTVAAKTSHVQSSKELSFQYLDDLTYDSPVDAASKFIDAAGGRAGRINIARPGTLNNFTRAVSPSYSESARGPSRTNKYWSYVLVHGAQNKTLSGIGEGPNPRESDAELGVYSFSFGGTRVRGAEETPLRGRTDITRAINFQKVKKPGQREMMVERFMNQEGNDNNIELWSIFDVDITMTGNNLFAPGKIIYVEPAAGAIGQSTRSISQELGLGGYYLITGVENIYDVGGKWETTIKAA